MPRIGDGTGLTGQPPTQEGLTHVGGDTPEKPSGPYKDGSATQRPAHDGPQRTTPAHGGKGM